MEYARSDAKGFDGFVFVQDEIRRCSPGLGLEGWRYVVLGGFVGSMRELVGFEKVCLELIARKWLNIFLG